MELKTLILASTLVLARLDRRIVGGSDSQAYPWMALIKSDGDEGFCGGTAIKTNLILTAAHCAALEIPRIPLRVYLNRTKLDTSVDEGIPASRVKEIISHSDYDAFRRVTHDIAIFRTDAPSHSTIVELDNGNFSQDGTMVDTIGWGLTQVRQKGVPFKVVFPTVLQTVTLPIVNSTRCRQSYPKTNPNTDYDPKVNLCAGYDESGKGSRQFDSGGPIFVKEHDRVILLGITTWSHGCAFQDKYDVLVRVSAFKDWIETIVDCIGDYCHQDGYGRILFNNGTIYHHGPIVSN